MCGRFTYKYTWREIHALLDLLWPPEANLAFSYNVAPTQQAPIVLLDNHSARGLTMARWGLLPAWLRGEKPKVNMINARSETIATSPAFRSAFRSRRCIVPVSGFYEWQKKGEKQVKQPWYIHRADGEILRLAGLYEPPFDPGEAGDAPPSFTIITTSANTFMTRLHDRMPAVLEPESVGRWLDPKAPSEALASLLVPAADGVLDAHAVSRRVNSPRENDAELIAPVDAA